MGIPMGANYSPLLADLFLFSCACNFMKNIDIDNSYRFEYITTSTRYIDNVAVINFPNFHINLSSIYPTCLEITKSADSNEVHYLDNTSMVN